jgi:hypothetical protein
MPNPVVGYSKLYPAPPPLDVQLPLVLVHVIF